MLIPPFRYSIVEEGLYRGAYPTRRNFRFLKRLKLKTIISLIPEPPSADLIQFCEEQNINNIFIRVDKFREEIGLPTMRPRTAIQIVQLLLDSRNLPLFLHGLDGAHITGLIIMCLRKLQNWTLSSIFSEFSRFLRDGHMFQEEAEFIEVLNEEITIPASPPSWLWNGEKITKHPTFKIKYQGEEKKTAKVEHALWKDPSEQESFKPNSAVLSRKLRALDLENGAKS